MSEFKSRIAEEKKITPTISHWMHDLLSSSENTSLIDALDNISKNPPCKLQLLNVQIWYIEIVPITSLQIQIISTGIAKLKLSNGISVDKIASYIKLLNDFLGNCIFCIYFEIWSDPPPSTVSPLLSSTRNPFRSRTIFRRKIRWWRSIWGDKSSTSM